MTWYTIDILDISTIYIHLSTRINTHLLHGALFYLQNICKKNGWKMINWQFYRKSYWKSFCFVWSLELNVERLKILATWIWKVINISILGHKWFWAGHFNIFHHNFISLSIDLRKRLSLIDGDVWKDLIHDGQFESPECKCKSSLMYGWSAVIVHISFNLAKNK